MPHEGSVVAHVFAGDTLKNNTFLMAEGDWRNETNTNLHCVDLDCILALACSDAIRDLFLKDHIVAGFIYFSFFLFFPVRIGIS
jgi:hypothetical protein